VSYKTLHINNIIISKYVQNIERYVFHCFQIRCNSRS